MLCCMAVFYNVMTLTHNLKKAIIDYKVILILMEHCIVLLYEYLIMQCFPEFYSEKAGK